MFHVTPSRAADVRFRAYLNAKVQGRVDGPRRKPYSLLSPAMRAENGRVTFTVASEPSSADYTPPRFGETVNIDTGPRLVRTVMDTVLGFLRVTVLPTGSLGEDLADAAENLDAVGLYDSAGKLMAWRLVQNPGVFITAALPPPDAYRLVIVGVGGTLTATFDTRKNI